MGKKEKKYKILDKKELPDSEIEISVEIEWQNFLPFREKALSHLKKEYVLPGFRKGAVPENIILEKIGEYYLIEEGIHDWAKENLLQIVEEEIPSAINAPKIVLMKAVKDNPVQIKIIFEKWPEFSLPDYKKIMTEFKAEKVEVKEKDVENTLFEMQKWLTWQKMEKEKLPMDKENFEKNLIPISDELAKIAGLENISLLKEKIKKEILEDKTKKEKQKKATKILDEIIKKANFSVTKGMIEEELDKIEMETKTDAEKMGMKYEDYLKQIKKNKEEFRNDLRENAEKRVKSQLVLVKISQEEKLFPNDKEVEEKTEEIIKHNKTLDKEKVKNYLRQAMSMEKVWRMFEEK